MQKRNLQLLSKSIYYTYTLKVSVHKCYHTYRYKTLKKNLQAKRLLEDGWLILSDRLSKHFTVSKVLI